MVEGPFALNTDGSARDPAAFQSALRSDLAKLQALQTEPDVVSVILGDDIPAMQDMLRSAYQVSCWGSVLVLSLSSTYCSSSLRAGGATQTQKTT